MLAEKEQVNMSDNLTKVSLRLTPEAMDTVNALKEHYGIKNLSEVFRKALGTEKYLVEQLKTNHRILIENKDDGITRELVLR